jgi:hypothetical protein
VGSTVAVQWGGAGIAEGMGFVHGSSSPTRLGGFGGAAAARRGSYGSCTMRQLHGAAATAAARCGSYGSGRCGAGAGRVWGGRAGGDQNSSRRIARTMLNMIQQMLTANTAKKANTCLRPALRHQRRRPYTCLTPAHGRAAGQPQRARRQTRTRAGRGHATDRAGAGARPRSDCCHGSAAAMTATQQAGSSKQPRQAHVRRPPHGPSPHVSHCQQRPSPHATELPWYIQRLSAHAAGP